MNSVCTGTKMLEPNLDLEEDPNVLGIRFDLIENVALIENVITIEKL